MFRVIIRSTRKKCEIYSSSTIKTLVVWHKAKYNNMRIDIGEITFHTEFAPKNVGPGTFLKISGVSY